jgi:hypothetical protein
MLYYIYEHRRLDTGAVFYVGRGLIYRKTKCPRRAYTKDKRNCIWHGIVTRNGGVFEVQIVFTSPSRDDVLHEEVRRIAEYGRIIDGTGQLSNITDGGDGSLGLRHSDATRAKLRAAHARNPRRKEMLRSPEFRRDMLAKIGQHPKPMLGKHHTAESCAKMAAHPNRRGPGHWYARKVVDTKTGTVYGCVADAADSCGYARSSLYTYLKKSSRRPNPTAMRYVDDV